MSSTTQHKQLALLSVAVISKDGVAHDIEFPLHPETNSGKGIGTLLTALLETISTHIGSDQALRSGDILQALSMTMAVRALMDGDDQEAIQDLQFSLLKNAHQAIANTNSYSSGRA